MEHLIRKVDFDQKPGVDLVNQVLYCEWLFTNGLGGYSSTALCGATTRKYHGLLVASLPAPYGRRVMLSYAQDAVTLSDGKKYDLSFQEFAHQNVEPEIFLTSFRLENGIPYWTYTVKDVVIEKTIFMPYRQNSVHITYTLQSGPESELQFQPYFNFRHHEDSVQNEYQFSYAFSIEGERYEVINEPYPSLKIFSTSEVKCVLHNDVMKNILYRIEAERGYDSVGTLYSQGSFHAKLEWNKPVTFVVSTESWEVMTALTTPQFLDAEKERREKLIRDSKMYYPAVESDRLAFELVLAADQYVIIPASRTGDITWTKSIGEEARTVIAGYHWFTDWGRDAMITLEGLTLITGRIQEGGYILKTFAHHIKDGLVPNMFPDGKNEGVYHTADATLWFFHALDRYLTFSHDEGFLISLIPKIKEVLEYHIKGTRFGIGVDPSDGLLRQGHEGYALTWMDAKVGDFVVTPRRGKAVEINALWYNALRLCMEWFEKYHETFSYDLASYAKFCRDSFNQKFWISSEGYLYDVVDGEKGNDAACRPNQLFAFSLKYPILDKNYWKPVLDTVTQKLFTPVGLRTLSPDHPDYKVTYHGNLFLRDSAYHQGTIWPWLLGPFVDDWIKVYPDRIEEIKVVLEGFNLHAIEGCVGSISEIFDAREPYTHRGCIAQAWSVAELLRAWEKVQKLTKQE